MDVLTGKSASAGIAIGKVRFIGHSGGRPEQYRIEDIEAQKSRFSEAKTRTLEKLDAV